MQVWKTFGEGLFREKFFSPRVTNENGIWKADLYEEEGDKKIYTVFSNEQFLCLHLGCYEPSLDKIFKESGKYHINKQCDYILLLKNCLIFIELKTTLSEKSFKLACEQLRVSPNHWEYIKKACCHVINISNRSLSSAPFPEKYYFCVLAEINKERNSGAQQPLTTSFKELRRETPFDKKTKINVLFVKKQEYSIQKMISSP